jgi:hypothetical protein
MIELTQEQQRALDASDQTPAKVRNQFTGRCEVLLRSDDFEWIRRLLGDEPDAPRGTDTRTGQEYALLPEERYERFKAFFEEDPLTSAEKTAILREAGRRAGWDSRVWDRAEGSQEDSCLCNEATWSGLTGRTATARGAKLGRHWLSKMIS